jgi:hypothetical protein
LITTEIEGETHEMNKKAQAFKIQEVHRTSKGIVMRRLIDKEQQPQCQVEMAEVAEDFRETSSMSLEDVVEAEEGSIFIWVTNYRSRRRKRRKTEEFLLGEENIAKVIKSQEDLTTSGIDGISSRIMKGAGAE